MVTLKLFVEGGGDATLLRNECRQGFSKFLSRAGLAGRMPRIVSSGSRMSAYKDFCTAIANGERALLLVDSEGPVEKQHASGDDRSNWRPWLHLAQRVGDGWAQPQTADDPLCHLMVQCMETWFLADPETLKSFYSQGFKSNALPPNGNPIEGVAKSEVFKALEKATKDCNTKGPYGKAAHSFKLLGLIDPAKVVAASPWAKRFVDEIKRQMAC